MSILWTIWRNHLKSDLKWLLTWTKIKLPFDILNREKGYILYMKNEKYSKRLMMSLSSLHKTIAARKLENNEVDISNSNKISDIPISKFNKVMTSK